VSHEAEMLVAPNAHGMYHRPFLGPPEIAVTTARDYIP
jgi:hypothetical protein